MGRQGLVSLAILEAKTAAHRESSANDVFNLEIAAGGTQFQANSASVAAFSTLFLANQWMIFRNVVTGVLHWDFVSRQIYIFR